MQKPVSLVIFHSTTAMGLTHPDELVPVLVRDWTVEIFEERMGTLRVHQGVAAHIADAVCVEVIKAFDLIRLDLVHVKAQLETAIQDLDMTDPIARCLHKMTVSRDLPAHLARARDSSRPAWEPEDISHGMTNGEVVATLAKGQKQEEQAEALHTQAWHHLDLLLQRVDSAIFAISNRRFTFLTDEDRRRCLDPARYQELLNAVFAYTDKASFAPAANRFYGLALYSQLKPVLDARGSLRQVLLDPAGPPGDRGATATTAGKVQKKVTGKNEVQKEITGKDEA